MGGDVIDLMLIAPGHGNIAAIVTCLKDMRLWPLKQKLRVMMYSGSFNLASTTDADITALEEIMQHSDRPLVDLSKFPFFGGENSHQWADSLTTFVTPDFAPALTQRWPLLAAVLKVFNDEFNIWLVEPDVAKLFGKNTLTKADVEIFEERIKPKFKPKSMQAYCHTLIDEVTIFDKVKAFKKSTIRAFAAGGCDSPLCDQLLFLYLWMSRYRKSDLVIREGKWRRNEHGFSEVGPTGLFPAVQPILKDPCDEQALLAMRHALQDGLFRYMSRRY